MRVRDDKLHPAQAAAPELSQKIGPEGLGLGGTDVHPQDLSPAIAVHTNSHNHRHGDDAPVLAHFHIGGVDPEIGPVAFDGPVQEGFDTYFDLFAQTAHLAL